MLVKDPEQRYNINQVDEAIIRIDLKSFLKSKDIFDGILNVLGMS